MEKKKLRYLIQVTANKLNVYVQYETFIQLKYISDFGQDNLSPDELNLKKKIHDQHSLTLNKKKTDIISVVKQHLANFPQAKTVLFASSFYNQLTQLERQQWIEEIYQQTGLFFNILSVDLEKFYFNKGMTGNYSSKDPLLLMSITEDNIVLTIVQNSQVITTRIIDFGTRFLAKKFPELKKRYSSVSLDNVVKECLKILPEFDYNFRCVVYGGGKLDYMQTLSYDLQGNVFYTDREHPALITVEDFKRRNIEMFSIITIKELLRCQSDFGVEQKDPRANFALAQAVCEKYQIRHVIPSNTNVLHGVAKQEFRRVVISQSKDNKNKKILLENKSLMKKIIKKLSKVGTQVLSPRIMAPDLKKGDLNLKVGRRQVIAVADALIILNTRGYISPKVMLDIGFAQAFGTRIIFTELPQWLESSSYFNKNLKANLELPVPAEVGLWY